MRNSPSNRSPVEKGSLPFYRSLSFRLGLWIGVIVLGSVVLFAYFSIRSQKEQLIRQKVREAERLSEALIQSVERNMRSRDSEGIQTVVQTTASRCGIADIKILSHSGQVRFCTEIDRIGHSVDEQARVCVFCHEKDPPLQTVGLSKRAWTYRSARQKDLLAVVTPIYNKNACSNTSCHIHPANEPILGVLEVGMRVDGTNKAVSGAVREIVWFSLILFVVVAALLSFVLLELVGKPARRMLEAVRQMSCGDYDRRLEVASSDEWGELAESFNVMGDRIQAREEELKRSREEFQTLFENVPSYIAVVDRDYKIVQANRNFKNTFGDRVGELCFRAYKGLTTRCEDCPVERTFQTGKPQVSEEHGVSSNGHEVYYLVYTAPVLDDRGEVQNAIEMSIDLTETKRLEKELRASREFLNNLIENSIHGIVAVDAKGEVIVFNRSAEDILGYRAREVIGSNNLERFFPGGFTHRVERVLKENHDVEPVTIAEETTLQSKAGEEIPVSFAGVILQEEASPVGAVGFFQDLREFKMLEREKLQAERLAVVGQTVAALAHGIKNIITGLEGGVYVIQTAMKRDDDSLLQKGWGMVERNIEKISHLVKDLLSYSRVSVAEAEPTNPNEVVEEVYSLFEDRAEQEGIELAMDLGDDLGEAYLDEKAIHTCLTNLVSNAIDACTEDEQGEEHTVTLKSRREADHSVTFEVEDTGVGMDEEVVGKLFKNFFTTKGTKGTGLGLMVTHKLVHEHGGEISAQSRPGEGSRFRMTIPQRKGEDS